MCIRDRISTLRDEHLLRVKKNPNLQYILSIRKRYEEQKNKDVVSLNIENRKLEKEERQIWALDIENKRRSSLDLEIFTSFQAMEDYNELKKEEDEIIKINLDDDYILNEGTQILTDFTIFNQSIYLTKAS